MSTESVTAIKCTSCGEALPLPAFLDACSSFHATTNTVTFNCPGCRNALAVRLSSFEVELGYLYAAGAAHFAREETISAPELLAYRRESTLIAEVDELKWIFSVHKG